MTQVRPVQHHRAALMELLRSPWTELWLVTPELDAGAAALIQPFLKREGARVRVLTHLASGRLAGGKVDLMALQGLRMLPGVEVRSLPEIRSCVYAVGRGGPAVISAAPLTLDGLDSDLVYGTWLPGTEPSLQEDLERWWARARALTEVEWADLVVRTSTRLEARTVGDELASIGAFVRMSMRGTRRSRRLDPKEFGVPEGEWGRAVRQVVAIYQLDEVIRAKEDLEAVLAEEGLEWNGYYLVSRSFLERDWPRLFSARKRQLHERLNSPEGRADLKGQITRARQELEAFFGEIYPRAETGEMDAETWVRVQTDRVLTETISGSILEESDLEYRVLSILPEDKRSVEELQLLLEDPKLRSVQLMFNF